MLLWMAGRQGKGCGEMAGEGTLILRLSLVLFKKITRRKIPFYESPTVKFPRFSAMKCNDLQWELPRVECRNHGETCDNSLLCSYFWLA